jgi:hypothetical protein
MRQRRQHPLARGRVEVDERAEDQSLGEVRRARVEDAEQQSQPRLVVGIPEQRGIASTAREVRAASAPVAK